MPAMPSGSNVVLDVKKVNGKPVFVLDPKEFKYGNVHDETRETFARDIEAYYAKNDIKEPLPQEIQDDIRKMKAKKAADTNPAAVVDSHNEDTHTSNSKNDESSASPVTSPATPVPSTAQSGPAPSSPDANAHAAAPAPEAKPVTPTKESTDANQTSGKPESEKTGTEPNQPSSAQAAPVPPKHEEQPVASSEPQAQPAVAEKPVSDAQPPAAHSEGKASEATVPPAEKEVTSAEPKSEPKEHSSAQDEPKDAGPTPTPVVTQPTASETASTSAPAPAPATAEKEQPSPEAGKDTPMEPAAAKPAASGNEEGEKPTDVSKPNSTETKPESAETKPASEVNPVPEAKPTEKTDPATSPEAGKVTPKEPEAPKPEVSGNENGEKPAASGNPDSAVTKPDPEVSPAPEEKPVPETKPTGKTELTTPPEAKSDKETTTGSGAGDEHKESAAAAGETTPPSNGADTHSTESKATEANDGHANSGNAGSEETNASANAEDESNGNLDNHEEAQPLTPEQKSVIGLTSQAVGLWSAEMNDVSKRLGDLHFVHGEHGAWVRVYGGQYKSHFTLDDEAFNARTDFSALQVGADTVLQNQTRVGLALSTMAVKNKDTDNKANLLGLTAYATFEPTENDYVDLVAKLAHVNNKFAAGKIKQWGYSASAEVGHRFELVKGLTLTPNAELTIGQLKGKSGTIDDDTFTLGNVNNTTGRIGADLGYQYPTGSIALKASVVRDFGNKINFKVNDQQADINLGGTHVVLGLKDTQTLGQNWNVYYNLEKSFRGNMKLTWRGDLGVRYNF